ncbi:sulfur carrier protein ThiS [Streptomyces harbinensis]|uniref:sulfur carrier protein ThiS n=1 Tax=Streptomyces harbinensis TaxID=1176198 RepID=UPI0015921FFA|nr:sulfur carrier protein ThiS [Streptomyces harbinensis]QKV68380.1 sulfur carrier protein ThiS [Streptomyces harbinensis]
MTMTVNVTVNGAARAVPAETTLAGLVAALLANGSGAGVAAAVNACVVPRTRWAGTVLAEGDRVEILTAVQGG